MLQSLKAVLRERLADSSSPVERDIAALLEDRPAEDDRAAFRLRRYHRKIDVARRVMAAYDDRIDKATSAEPVSDDGYMALALVFMAAAEVEQGADEVSRGNTLRWVNSAFNCLDQVRRPDQAAMSEEADAELRALMKKAILA